MKNAISKGLLLLGFIGIFGCQSSPETNAKEAAIKNDGVFQQTANKGNYPATIEITGSGATQYAGQSVTLFRIDGNSKQPATTINVDDDGSFSSELKVKRPAFYLLGNSNQYVILDHNNIKIEVGENGEISTKGSFENEMLLKFQEINGKLNEEGAQQQQKFAAEADREKAMADYQAFVTKAVTQLKSFVTENNTPFASMLILSALDPDQEAVFLESTVSTLNEKYPNVPELENMAASIAAGKKTAVGEVAPDIALQSPEGEVVKLSSLRGNYVLIDFWASWCGPCRKENPNVVKMYNRFKGKKFEIYSVSLDRQRDKWLNAIEKDQLKWVHVSDLKFWQSAAAQTYNVTAIPMTFLLDPEGKIVAKNLRGKELERKLEELL